MKYYQQSLEQTRWNVRDLLVGGLSPELGTDRVQSEVATRRYAVRQALAAQRRQSSQRRSARRLLARRQTRPAVPKTA